MGAFLKSFAVDECGATAIEYGLIAALLGTALVTAVTGVGGALNLKFNAMANALNSAGAH